MSVTVGELMAVLRDMPPEAEVVAFTQFTATYGEGVWVHVAKANLNQGGSWGEPGCVTLEEKS